MASLLYVITHSTDDPDRAATALAAAAAAADDGHEVALWLTGEGVRLGVDGLDAALAGSGTPAPAKSLEILRLRGVTLHCSRPCLALRELGEDVLRADAVAANPEDLALLVAEGRTPVPT